MPKQEALDVLSSVEQVSDDIGAQGSAKQLDSGVTGQEGNAINGTVVDLSVDIRQLRPDRIERKSLRRCPDPACDAPEPTREQFVGPDSGPVWPQGHALMAGKIFEAPRVRITGDGKVSSVRDRDAPENRLDETNHVASLGCMGCQQAEQITEKGRIRPRQHRLQILAQAGDTSGS